MVEPLKPQFDESEMSENLIPKISDESLAKITCTSQSSATIYLNRFREFGLVDYNGGIRVHRFLLNLMLHDRLPGGNAAKPPIITSSLRPAWSAKRTPLSCRVY